MGAALKIVTDDNQLKEPKFNYKAELLKLVSNVDIVDDYIAVGKTAKRTPTKTGLTLFINECDKYNLSYEKAMIIVIDKGWRGFTYSWLKEEDFDKYGLRKKQSVKKEIPITMEQVKNILSNEEKEARILADKIVINKCFVDFMDELGTIDLPTIKFDSLVEYGCIKLASESTPTLQKYYDNKFNQAIEILKEKYKEEKATSLDQKRTFQNINVMLDARKYPEINVRSKELVVIDYFNKLIKDGKNKVFEV
jgi:hypothetical protein